jgi:hypothetical protein
MAKCGCASSRCSCKITGGSGIVVTGSGTESSPYVISSDGSGTYLNVIDTATVNLTLTGNGSIDSPYTLSGEAAVVAPLLVLRAQPVGTLTLRRSRVEQAEPRARTEPSVEQTPATPATAALAAAVVVVRRRPTAATARRAACPVVVAVAAERPCPVRSRAQARRAPPATSP